MLLTRAATTRGIIAYVYRSAFWYHTLPIDMKLEEVETGISEGTAQGARFLLAVTPGPVRSFTRATAGTGVIV